VRELEKNILVADDNEGIIDILSTYLEREGFTPIAAFDGDEAIIKFKQFNPILILLDIMMPKKDGLTVCKEIRKEANTPIIMITAKNEDSDIIMGLDIGADDYVVKPFSPGAVMARVKAVLRRIEFTEDQKKDIISFPQLEINIADYQVKMDNEIINLTKKEIEILWLLASNPNKVFSRDNLLSSIWGYDYCGDTRAVDTHMKRMRSKLKAQNQYVWDIKTIWGVGYKFEVRDA
jgi:DNA-binding response OmpR family regulator